MIEEQLRLLAQTLFNAITEGSTYALIAVGYTMVYGIVRLVNFAHGEVFMVGAVVAHWLFTAGQVAFFLALPLSMLLCAGLGWSLDKAAYKPLRRSTRLAALITAIGMSLVLQTVVQLALGPNPRAFPETAQARVVTADAPGRSAPDPSAPIRAKLRLGAKPTIVDTRGDWVGVSWNTGGQVETLWALEDDVETSQGLPGSFNTNLLPTGIDKPRFLVKDLLIWAAAAGLMIGLHFLVQRTRIGRAMRACAQDPTTAALMGVNVDRVIAFTFMVGSALAAVAGVLYAVRAGGNISFRMGYYPGVIAFAAAVLGGIGEIKGAVLGGMLLGVARAFWAQYMPQGLVEYDFAFCFSVMIVVIIFRPYGILGRAGATRA